MARNNVAEETIDRMAHRLLAPRNSEAMPVILCRRFFPHPRTYLQFDAGWEGLRKVTRAGRAAWEIDNNFQLRIEIDGLCEIPDTKNNRKRLEICSKEHVAVLDKDPITGIPYPIPQTVKYPAEYSRVDQTILEKTIIEQIAEKVFEKMKSSEEVEPELRAAPGPDNRPASQRGREALPVLDEDGLDDNQDRGIGEDPDAATQTPAPRRAPKPAPKAGKAAKRKPAAKAKSAKRGRPQAPDPLLEPIPGRL